jgi:hypothetical protein
MVCGFIFETWTVNLAGIHVACAEKGTHGVVACILLLLLVLLGMGSLTFGSWISLIYY